ncbi:MAG: hypothetical protein JKY51_05765, partial [Opitutaceae bacterium]|nr:hypothetical protein [Opitutaceae bacterium]
NEETLEFVEKCDKEFNLNVVWVESVIHEGWAGTTHKIVNFETANRDGSIFEKMIEKYGIPNLSWMHCSRELKTRAIDSYLKSIGWMTKRGNMDVINCHRAIGYRADEIDRVKSTYIEDKIIYPLAFEHPMTKQMINTFWRDMPFRLELKGYEGNCKFCWKKSLRKQMTLATERPEIYEFTRRMEKLHGKTGAGIEEGTGCNSEGNRVFFRGNNSTEDIFAMAQDDFNPAIDDSVNYEVQMELLGELDELDQSNGCEESCEAY